MVALRLVDPARVVAMFDEIQPKLSRFPAIDVRSFRGRIENVLKLGCGRELGREV